MRRKPEFARLTAACVAAVWIVAVAVVCFAGHADDDPGANRDHRLWVFKESVALGVPEQDLVDLVATCREQGFTSSEIQRVLALVAKAKLAGLPHEALLDKLREGLAKRAEPEAIDAALSAKAQTLRRAKSVVDDLLMEGWVAVDYAIAIQITAEALETHHRPQKIMAVVRGDAKRPEGMPDVAGAFRQASALENESRE